MAVYWGRACCLPCEAAAAMCEGCSRACDGLCDRCDCSACCCPPGKPSPVFLSYTLAVCGLPAAVAAVAGLVALTDHCDQKLQLYLILNVRVDCPTPCMSLTKPQLVHPLSHWGGTGLPS